ncbi:rhodanese-like domain-containing protein [Agaribacter marinus]|uniref:Rhodanese-like domain-containing protein n=1 Tax=Agaribacter marinus TaxID=1431249 RepID=A0AA37T034_9ALTE|nr:rhodanese-like domain-containing protein [Agaribacter marinus]GLR72337.1 rhodanese-like domain-containing protein [Agaribacter marinus]
MDHILEFAQDNLILAGIWVALIIMLIYSFIAPMLSAIKRVNNHEATLLINKEDAIILDIRAQKDFKSGHIHGAKQIKPEDVREGNFSQLEKDKNTPIIVVCAMGNLASGAANKMSKQGFSNVSVLEGGMNAWQSASLPVSK